MEKVIAIFDIGKTNKKLILFNSDLKIVYQHEEIFNTVVDEDGFECDDIDHIERWIKTTITELSQNRNFELAGLNFTTYGASLVYLNKNGKRISPVYNYLKPINEHYANILFEKNSGEIEFCRQTASPALGVMLNSGIQLEWVKNERPAIFSQTNHVLHFPQYLSFLFTGQPVSEFTSIGCHTFMWNFDKMEYHVWVKNSGYSLPDPISNYNTFNSKIDGKPIEVGIGIHDSSASLVPYFQGSDDKFLLVSTGTWCINMNPFNYSQLTTDELNNDCLCYLSVNQKPVKSSRFFMGHIHDINVQRLNNHFNVGPIDYKNVKPDEQVIKEFLEKGNNRVFFRNKLSENYLDSSVDLNQFSTFEKAYTRLLFDLTLECINSINLVFDNNNGVNNIFISGGFARNEIFVRLLAHFFPEKKIFTSQVDNSSALGAALVIYKKIFSASKPDINLGLKEWKGYNTHSSVNCYH